MIGLPIDGALPRILSALEARGAVVVEASPGAGKTTRVPRALLDHLDGDIVVLEPRRLAARMAAARVAGELGETVGQRVGYRVRFDSQVSRDTRLTFVTEGVLTRRLATDPQLRGVSAVVIDELHERHLQCDLALALLERLRRRARPELRLVAMSATLDAAKVTALLDADHVKVDVARFPIAVEHVASRDPLDVAVASAVRRLAREGLDGHVLVFLPGVADIRRAAERCAAVARDHELSLLPLHGSLSAGDQDRALAPSARRKLILSTNVAETSLTIDGVAAVIDSGLVKIAVQHPWSTLPRLELRRICRASATQRAGRAGRTRAGRCLRLYAEHELARQPEHETPEIERSDLCEPMLSLALAGARDDVRWLSPPPREAWASAERVLRSIGALDGDAGITTLGRRLAALPLHPRLGRALVHAHAAGVDRRACEAIAALSDLGRSERVLLWERVAELRDARHRKYSQTVRQLQTLCRSFPPPDGEAMDQDDALTAALARGFPDRIAQRKQGAELQLCDGGRASAGEASHALGSLCIVLDAELGRPGAPSRVRLATPIDADLLLTTFLDDIVDEVRLELNGDTVEQVSRLCYRQLVIEQTRRRADPSPEASALLFDTIGGSAGLARAGGPPLERLLARLRHAGLAPDLDALARRACEGMVSLRDLRDAGLEHLIRAETDVGLLERLAPDTVRIGDSRVPVSYPDGAPPFVATYLQDFFGMREGPRIGAAPLVLQLWAPNRRAVQVTSDLSRFWQVHYPELRRQLMRRYPKHHWPEDPTVAPPVRLKRRLH